MSPDMDVMFVDRIVMTGVWLEAIYYWVFKSQPDCLRMGIQILL